MEVGYGSVLGQALIMSHTRSTGHPDIGEMTLSSGFGNSANFELFNIEGKINMTD